MPINFKDPETFARTIGVPAKSLATFKSIGAWAAAASTVYGVVVVVLDVLDKVLGDEDPVRESLDALRQEVRNLTDTVIAGQLGAKLEAAAAAHGRLIVTAGVLRDFLHQHGSQDRETLLDRIDGIGDEVVGRSFYTANRLPFTPAAYTMLSGEPAPNWLAGHGFWLRYQGFPVPNWLDAHGPGPLPTEEQSSATNRMFFGSLLHTGSIQVLQLVYAGTHDVRSPPANLQLNALRWDGRFNHALLVFGAFVYGNTLRAVEPYHRTTGYRHERLTDIVDALSRFGDDWERQLLWTADMPSPGPPQNQAASLLFGFDVWPCGAVDPVFGTSSLQEDWWAAESPPDWGVAGVGGTKGLMSASQGQALASGRSAALHWVKLHNGLSHLRQTANSLRALLEPPWASESLTIFHDRATTAIAGVLGSTPATAKSFNILTPPVTFDGVHESRHVRVRVPIAIQGNPGLDDVPNLPRLAASDVTFGYRVELVEDDARTVVFEAPLRRTLGQPGVWHTAAVGAAALQPVPRSTQPVTLNYTTRTYLRYVDPTGGLHRQDHFEPGTVAITCRVTVTDAAHEPVPGLGDEWPPRGVVWLEIESNNVSNRSFELNVDVIETTAVAANGTPSDDPNALVTYHSSAVVPVDARVGVFPKEYHERYAQEKEAFERWLEAMNDRYSPAQPLGPPRPDDPFERFRGVLDLIDDPRWGPAVLAGFDRATAERVRAEPDVIRRGVDQLREASVFELLTPSAAFRVETLDARHHR